MPQIFVFYEVHSRHQHRGRDSRAELTVTKSTMKETHAAWEAKWMEEPMKHRAGRHDQQVLKDVLLPKGFGVSVMGTCLCGSISTQHTHQASHKAYSSSQS